MTCTSEECTFIKDGSCINAGIRGTRCVGVACKKRVARVVKDVNIVTANVVETPVVKEAVMEPVVEEVAPEPVEVDYDVTVAEDEATAEEVVESLGTEEEEDKPKKFWQ